MDALISSGLWMAWWMLVPGFGVAVMWLLAVVADREIAPPQRSLPPGK